MTVTEHPSLLERWFELKALYDDFLQTFTDPDTDQPSSKVDVPITDSEEARQKLLWGLCYLRAAGRRSICDSLMPMFLEAVGRFEGPVFEDSPHDVNRATMALYQIGSWFVPVTNDVSQSDELLVLRTGLLALRTDSCGDTQLALLIAVRDHPGKGNPSATDLHIKVGGHVDHIRKVLALLRKAGYLTSRNPGYKLTEKGEAEINRHHKSDPM